MPLGSRHPITLVRNEITDIFGRLGFTIAEGPEIEDDWHVFSALNFAEDHPARDMQDTFFIGRNPDVLLRTHTSSVQARVMEHTQPPNPHNSRKEVSFLHLFIIPVRPMIRTNRVNRPVHHIGPKLLHILPAAHGRIALGIRPLSRRIPLSNKRYCGQVST